MDKRQLQAKEETKAGKQHRRYGSILQNDLESAVFRSGGTLLGASFYFKGYEVLLVVKAKFDDGAMVGFASSGTPGQALHKAEATISDGSFKWKTDKWSEGIA